jgi:hypothetical protein
MNITMLLPPGRWYMLFENRWHVRLVYERGYSIYAGAGDVAALTRRISYLVLLSHPEGSLLCSQAPALTLICQHNLVHIRSPPSLACTIFPF